MGALHEDSLPLSQRATAPVFQDRRRHTKPVFDNLHETIYLDPLSQEFIDTEQFQRLRDVKQLGMCHLVFPGAVHTRFEHSLGVYYLAGQAIGHLDQSQRGELGIDSSDIRTVKLAGLLHDVGHGPFSHVFENEFLPKRLSGAKWCHEEMSQQMVQYIVDEHSIDIPPEDLRKVKDMIVASSHLSAIQDSHEKRFLFDIVANGRNGIDVDKFDYIHRDCRASGLSNGFNFKRLMENMRVIDNEICYRAKEYINVYELFQKRALLFRTVYTHAKVKALEYMLVDALLLADDYLGISKHVHDPQDFWHLDDGILKTIETSDKEELKAARDVVLRMRRRDLYRYCNEYVVPKDQLEHFKDVKPADIVCSQRRGGSISIDDVVVSNVKIDLTRGKENPVNRVRFFQDYESTDKFPIDKERVTHLLPDCFEDRIVRVYTKDPDLVDLVSEAFENFQLKTYGVKAQVHGTPNGKKRPRHH